MSRVEADFFVPEGHPSLAGHFPGDPIVPGVLLLDHVLSLLRSQTGRQVTHLEQVKFIAALRPQEQAHVLFEVQDGRVAFQVTVQRDALDVTVASGRLSLYDPRATSA